MADDKLSFKQAMYAELKEIRPGQSLSSDNVKKLMNQADLRALCFSGGGIRSATFSLGILQGLAAKFPELLEKFDYLSTVSGGGYVGSWLSAWIKREQPDGFSKVVKQLGDPKTEPHPVTHLRDYSNYLDPSVGLLSADTWTLAATVIRNLLLNWMVLLPMLAMVLMIPRIEVAAVFHLPPCWAILSEMLGLALLAFSFAAGRLSLPSYREKRAAKDKARFGQGSFLRSILVPLVLGSVLFSMAWPRFVPPDLAWWTFALVGAAGHFFLCLFFPLKYVSPGKGLDLLAAFISGFVGGVGVWLVLYEIFNNPLDLRFAAFGSPAILLALLVATTVYSGLSSWVTNEEDREWWGRAGAWVFILSGSLTVINVLVIYGPIWVASLPQTIGAAGGVSGLISYFLGKSSKTSGKENKNATATETGLNWLAKLAPAIFLLAIALGVAIGTDGLIYAWPSTPDGPRWWNQHTTLLKDFHGAALVTLTSVFVGVFLFMGWFISVNKFSLHGMYRNRLVRTYMGASRGLGEDKRDPDPFTGFDEDDNLRMHELRGQRPFHVLNAALNLAGGGDLDWQERQAESFTFSPLHAGCGFFREPKSTECTGAYRDSLQYGDGASGPRPTGPNFESKSGVSIGTAVAISGAAANPNMGNHTSPVLAFVMTFLNARLGCWLGNPGKAGANTWVKRAPEFAPKHLVLEALALTDASNTFVNLSDGGHFENLGLYEMVRRQCRLIVVVDNGQDTDDPEKPYILESLGFATRLIRVDFQVEIVFKDEDLEQLRKRTKRFAIGDIRYHDTFGDGFENGKIILIKPVVLGEAGEPADVRHYAASNPDFPQQTTADQWFDESQFESYRKLGYVTVKEMQWHELDPLHPPK